MIEYQHPEAKRDDQGIMRCPVCGAASATSKTLLLIPCRAGQQQQQKKHIGVEGDIDTAAHIRIDRMEPALPDLGTVWIDPATGESWVFVEFEDHHRNWMDLGTRRERQGQLSFPGSSVVEAAKTLGAVQSLSEELLLGHDPNGVMSHATEKVRRQLENEIQRTNSIQITPVKIEISKATTLLSSGSNITQVRASARAIPFPDVGKVRI